MKNIVMLLSNSFRPDPRVLKEANSLQGNGYSVTILCWDRNSDFAKEEILSSGVSIRRIQDIRSSYGIGTRQLLRLPKFWLAVQSYLKEIKPNLVHCHDFDTLPAGLWYGLLNHLPVIYDAHEYYAELVKPRLKGMVGEALYRLIKWAELTCSRRSQAVVTVDETLASHYRKYNSRVVLLGHYPLVNTAESPNSVFTRPEITLIYAGRLSTDRGILIYADIARELISRHVPTSLILLGSFTPEHEQSILFDYAKDISEHIVYHGWLPYTQMSAAYNQADVGLAILMPEPRYVAATPVKLFEYMAGGLPVIASNFPAIAAVVSDAGCGILVDPNGDISAAVDQICSWWENRSIPQMIGENGRRAVLNKYNWESQVTSLLDLYSSLT